MASPRGPERRAAPNVVGFAVSALPLVSVCIANYNGSAMISGCIESVLGQDFDFPVEILVHDDASTDGSAEFVARDYPAVRLIRSESNVGFCVANNRMVAQAEGTYILLLNNDAELYPDALRVLHDDAESIGEPAILSLPQYDFVTGELIDRGCLLDPFFNPVPNLDSGRSDVAMVIGACLWIPQRLWTELGGFPEWFESIAEDMYLCCRARLAGYAVRALGISGYRHRMGQSFGGGSQRGGKLSTTFRRRVLSERNKTFVMAITCPPPLVWVLLPLHLCLLMVEGVLLSLLKFRGAYLTDIYLPLVPVLLHRRRELQAARSSIRAGNRISAKTFFSTFNLVPYKLQMLCRHGLPKVV